MTTGAIGCAQSASWARVCIFTILEIISNTQGLTAGSDNTRISISRRWKYSVIQALIEGPFIMGTIWDNQFTSFFKFTANLPLSQLYYYGSTLEYLNAPYVVFSVGKNQRFEMSRSHGRATTQNWDCANSWELYAQTKKISIFHTCYVILGVIFVLFLAQNFKTKVLTVQKNLLLECPERMQCRWR